MATTSSFKQQCPSCEAMVPIRDPGLVGKKIDCPKCKYRFLVEEPVPEEAEGDEGEATGGPAKSTAVTDKKGKGRRLRDDAVGPDEDEEAKGKSKTTNPMVLYIGIGLGVIALVALVGGGILLFGPSSAAKQPPSAAGAPPAPKPPPQQTVVAQNPPPAPAVVVEGGPTDDITNLLPNETAAVFGWDVGELLKSGVRRALLETPGSFTEATFQRTFDFPLENVKRVLTAVLASDKPGETSFFSIMQVDKPFNKNHLIQSLQLTSVPIPTGFECFTINGDLDTLSALFIRLSNPPSAKLALHFVDAQTIIIADSEPLKKFLEDKRRPRQLTQPPPPLPEPAGTPRAPQTVAQPTTATIPPATGKAAAPNPRGPGLNSNDGRNQNGVTLFQDPAGGQSVAKPGPKLPPGVVPPAPPPAPATGEQGPAAAPQGVEAEATASQSYLTIDPSLKIAIDRLEHDKVPQIFFVAASLSQAGSLPEEATSVAAIDKQQLHELFPRLPMPEGARVLAAALREFSEEKAAGMLVLQTESEQMARNAKAHADAAAEQISTLLHTNWAMDIKVDTSGFRGNQPTGSPRFNPVAIPVPQPQPTTTAATGKDGSIASWTRNKTLAINIELTLSRKLYEAIRDGLASESVQLKGHAELVGSRLRIHELARALQAYVKAKGAFPRGALQRPPSSDRGIDWYPDQRLSWMVELLPYLGDGEFKELAFDPEKAWNETPNLLTGQVLIPQFLSPGDRKSAQVRYPGKFGQFAATHFVGIAGVGLDAATYPAGNAEVAKRLGVFGYDRVTKLDDIKDGPENTIAILEVPAGQITPWLLGGGSTVRGVPDGDDSLKPFVSTEYKGKKGAFAIMADGKVRFIADDMKPATFRALCTIAGGERLDDINEVAPIVPEESLTELKAAPLAAATPPPEAKPPEAAAPPAAEAKSPLLPGWKEVLNEEAGYAIALPPGTPIDQQIPQPGTKGARVVGVRVQGTGGGYTITSTALPAPVPAAGLPAVFAQTRDMIVRILAGAKLVSETKIQLGEHQGMELTMDSPQGKMIARVFIVKDHAYTLTAVPVAKLDPKEVQAFFNSFRLLQK